MVTLDGYEIETKIYKGNFFRKSKFTKKKNSKTFSDSELELETGKNQIDEINVIKKCYLSVLQAHFSIYMPFLRLNFSNTKGRIMCYLHFSVTYIQ